MASGYTDAGHLVIDEPPLIAASALDDYLVCYRSTDPEADWWHGKVVEYAKDHGFVLVVRKIVEHSIWDVETEGSLYISGPARVGISEGNPDYFDLIKELRDSGLFHNETVDIDAALKARDGTCATMGRLFNSRGMRSGARSPIALESRVLRCSCYSAPTTSPSFTDKSPRP